MKKLLAVAAIGVVGYYVVKKIKERKNEEVEVNEVEEMENKEVENVEEEVKEEKINNEVEEDDRILQYLGPDEYIVADEEEIKVEIVDNVEEVKEENLFSKVRGLGKKLIKAPIQLVIKACGIICGVLVNMNKKLNNVKEIDRVDLAFMGNFEFYSRQAGLILGGLVIDINRRIVLVLVKLCKLLDKLI